MGITSFSLITATLTSEIVAANSVPPPTIEDANVGVIRHHTYEGKIQQRNADISLGENVWILYDNMVHKDPKNQWAHLSIFRCITPTDLTPYLLEPQECNFRQSSNLTEQIEILPNIQTMTTFRQNLVKKV